MDDNKVLGIFDWFLVVPISWVEMLENELKEKEAQFALAALLALAED